MKGVVIGRQARQSPDTQQPPARQEKKSPNLDRCAQIKKLQMVFNNKALGCIQGFIKNIYASSWEMYDVHTNVSEDQTPDPNWAVWGKYHLTL